MCMKATKPMGFTSVAAISLALSTVLVPTAAAQEVRPSHCSREYKRLFGEPPIRDVERLRGAAAGSTVGESPDHSKNAPVFSPNPPPRVAAGHDTGFQCSGGLPTDLRRSTLAGNGFPAVTGKNRERRDGAVSRGRRGQCLTGNVSNANEADLGLMNLRAGIGAADGVS